MFAKSCVKPLETFIKSLMNIWTALIKKTAHRIFLPPIIRLKALNHSKVPKVIWLPNVIAAFYDEPRATDSILSGEPSTTSQWKSMSTYQIESQVLDFALMRWSMGKIHFQLKAVRSIYPPKVCFIQRFIICSIKYIEYFINFLCVCWWEVERWTDS